MIKRVGILALLPLATLAGCTSHLIPLKPTQQVEVWIPDPATAPSTTSTAPTTDPATASAPATEPATQPGRLITKTVDPNRTTRFVYNASYDNVWKQARDLLMQTGFELDRQDYRLGVLTTRIRPSAQFLEFWKREHASVTDAMENTVNNQRRWITLSISAVEGKPEFYEIAVQVLVERETNPTEIIGGPLFVEGSGFGRNAITLRSDYTTTKVEASEWNTVGHDPDLERKLLDALFKRI